jgi:hypothetical protein
MIGGRVASHGRFAKCAAAIVWAGHERQAFEQPSFLRSAYANPQWNAATGMAKA